MNPECNICNHPELISIENICLAGMLDIPSMVKVLEQDSVYITEEDLLFHINNCMPKVKTQTSAVRTLKLIAETGEAALVAKRKYARLEQEYASIPPTESAYQLLPAINAVHGECLDLAERGKQLEVRLELQRKIINAALLYRNQMRTINRAAEKTTEREAANKEAAHA